jgi:hypothetical protein
MFCRTPSGLKSLSALRNQDGSGRHKPIDNPEDIVSYGERRALKGAIASAGALSRFFASIEPQMKHAEERE